MSTWFYMNGPERVGPVSQDQLCDLFRQGVLSLQTLVWSDAFKNWTEASKIAALRSLAPLPIDSTTRAGTPVASNIPFGGRAMSAPALDYETPNAVDGPVGIGGWLILPTIGLIFTPIAQALAVLGAVALANLKTTPANLASGLNQLAVANAIYGVYILVAAFMFFAKKRMAPAMMIGAYLLAIGLTFFSQVVVTHATQAASDPNSSIVVFARPVLVALIWIPYFRMSKRVRNTFVN